MRAIENMFGTEASLRSRSPRAVVAHRRLEAALEKLLEIGRAGEAAIRRNPGDRVGRVSEPMANFVELSVADQIRDARSGDFADAQVEKPA